MPTPHAGESQRKFVGRCMAYPDLRSKPPKQRAGECYGIYRQHSESKKALKAAKKAEAAAAKPKITRKNSQFADTMKAFRRGTLKDAGGNIVKCRKTARAMAVQKSITARHQGGGILTQNDAASTGQGVVLKNVPPQSASIEGLGGALRNFPGRKHTKKSCSAVCACNDCSQHVIVTTYKAADDRVGLVHRNKKEDIQTDDNEFSAAAILASSNRDRQGDIIECAGVVFTDHIINPISLWDHGKVYNLPIGMTESPEAEYHVLYHPDADVITQKTWFAPTKFARQIYFLVRHKYIRANSIAVKDLHVEKLPPDPEQGHFKAGKHIIKSSLAEVTWTPLPANPDAVASLLGRGYMDVGGFAEEQIEPLILKSMMPFIPIRKHWANGCTVTNNGLVILSPRRRKSHA